MGRVLDCLFEETTDKICLPVAPSATRRRPPCVRATSKRDRPRAATRSRQLWPALVLTAPRRIRSVACCHLDAQRTVEVKNVKHYFYLPAEIQTLFLPTFRSSTFFYGYTSLIVACRVPVLRLRVADNLEILGFESYSFLGEMIITAPARF